MTEGIKRLMGVVSILIVAMVACRSATPTSEPVTSSNLYQTMEALSVKTPVGTAWTATPAQESPVPPIEETLSPGASPTPQPLTPGHNPTIPVNTVIAPDGYRVYVTRPGETLEGLAGRFEVAADSLTYQQPFPPKAYLPGGLQIIVPELEGDLTSADILLPDSELIYSPSAADFDLSGFVQNAGGYLSTFSEEVDGELLSGAAIVQRVANELTINPRLLLAVLEQFTGWVYGPLRTQGQLDYPFGFMATGQKGFYDELRIAATQLNLAYYGWKTGNYTLIKYPDQTAQRLHPFINPATAGLHNLFAMLYSRRVCWTKLAGADGFVTLYQRMFGDPWARAAAVEPLIPIDLVQPVLELPFPAGEFWSFTSGPHWAWNYGTPWGALDFAPANHEARCEVSKQWATAAAAGLVVRAEHNTVVLDLDGDGSERTGWNLVYFHMATEGLIQQGTWVQVNDPVGHPSCQGGSATGSHVHLARKYNGEWLPADGSVAFTLSGYLVRGNGTNYQGELVKGSTSITACPYGCEGALIRR